AFNRDHCHSCARLRAASQVYLSQLEFKGKMIRFVAGLLFLSSLLSCAPRLGAQHGAHSSHDSVSGMEAEPSSFLSEITAHELSGTSAEPNSVERPMVMLARDSWMLMFHGVAFFNVQQQSGPRGADKVFSTSWFMPMAQRPLAHGTLTLRAM